MQELWICRAANGPTVVKDAHMDGFLGSASLLRKVLINIFWDYLDFGGFVSVGCVQI